LMASPGEVPELKVGERPPPTGGAGAEGHHSGVRGSQGKCLSIGPDRG
jgi:hypothetical protein